MVDQELIDQYSRSVSELLEQSVGEGISEEEFRKIYFECLQEVQIENEKQANKWKILTRKNLIFIVVFIAIVGTLNFRLVYSHLQEYIYPGLKLLRKLSIPFISLFPSLTEFYHDTCLVQNPLFTVVDMECWPCSAVTSIRVLDEPLQSSHQHSSPFVYKSNQKAIRIKDLNKMYYSNKELITKEASKVFQNNKYYISPKDMFKKLQNSQEKNFFLWKFNTMNTGRLLRQTVPRPQVVPKFGQSIERFILIDNSRETFKVPDTECSYAFILLLSGSRTIDLHPADECKHQCRMLRIDVKESYLLWYNWWYWKPMINPSTENDTLVAHIGSYC